MQVSSSALSSPLPLSSHSANVYTNSSLRSSLAALEALVNFLPSAKTPQHVKGVALHIIKKGTEYLKKWEHKKDVNTDDLIDLVAKLILKVNPGHLRSTAWALTYYDVRGGSGEGMYASAVLSSAVEYLKNGDHGNNNSVGSYEEVSYATHTLTRLPRRKHEHIN